MRPNRVSYTPLTPDPNGIFEDQTTVGAANLSLDGAGVSGGVWTASDGMAHQISLESAGDESDITFTITGTDADGRAISEAVTGPNASTVESSSYFLTITQIATSGAVGNAVEGGPVDEAVSPTFPLASATNDFEVGLYCTVSGTINYDMQVSGTDIWDTDVTINWHDHDTIAGETTNQKGEINVPATAARILLNSYTAGATITLETVQSR